ncbi:hypothetical protein HK100_009922 [Physocladia obscura]|uniref:Uncharacterized protein n=1 Tax=Physocladia obscura TaxID=109957 RepID=A0AAD5XHE4_9FUNG|nr:hypothetical protein HK100_009922 [Physocladia obscura]
MSLALLKQIANSSKIHYNIAIILASIGKEERAIVSLSKAIEIDSYFALAYFVRGILFSKREYYLEAVADFTDAIKCMRSAPFIDYDQLGATHKLYMYEVFFNRGIVFSALSKVSSAISDFDRADAAFLGTPVAREFLNANIDQAVDLAARAHLYVSLYMANDFMAIVFRPPKAKLEALDLGKTGEPSKESFGTFKGGKVVAGVDEQDGFVGFSGNLVKTEEKLKNKGPLDEMPESFMKKTTIPTDPLYNDRKTEAAGIARKETLRNMLTSIDSKPPTNVSGFPDAIQRAATTDAGRRKNTEVKRAQTGLTKIDEARMEKAFKNTPFFTGDGVQVPARKGSLIQNRSSSLA